METSRPRCGDARGAWRRQVELSEEEEKLSFVPKGAVSDLAPNVLAKAFASFTVPEKSEGFDEALGDVFKEKRVFCGSGGGL